MPDDDPLTVLAGPSPPAYATRLRRGAPIPESASPRPTSSAAPARPGRARRSSSAALARATGPRSARRRSALAACAEVGLVGGRAARRSREPSHRRARRGIRPIAGLGLAVCAVDVLPRRLRPGRGSASSHAWREPARRPSAENGRLSPSVTRTQVRHVAAAAKNPSRASAGSASKLVATVDTSCGGGASTSTECASDVVEGRAQSRPGTSTAARGRSGPRARPARPHVASQPGDGGARPFEPRRRPRLAAAQHRAGDVDHEEHL